MKKATPAETIRPGGSLWIQWTNGAFSLSITSHQGIASHHAWAGQGKVSHYPVSHTCAYTVLMDRAVRAHMCGCAATLRFAAEHGILNLTYLKSEVLHGLAAV